MIGIHSGMARPPRSLRAWVAACWLACSLLWLGGCDTDTVVASGAADAAASGQGDANLTTEPDAAAPADVGQTQADGEQADSDDTQTASDAELAPDGSTDGTADGDGGPADADPDGTSLDAVTPADADPADTNPADAELADAELADASPADTDPTADATPVADGAVPAETQQVADATDGTDADAADPIDAKDVADDAPEPDSTPLPTCPTLCDDQNPCTDDTCVQGACAFAANAAPCDDGNACTSGDTCADSQCTGAALGCDDGNPCTADGCDSATGCLATALTATCDDGDACTEGEACADGTCGGGTVLACGDTNPCTADSCEASTGCMWVAQTGSCDDGNACSGPDSCASGSCAGPTLPCDDKKPCTMDSCDKKLGCQHDQIYGPCDDGSDCTTDDHCQDGSCVSTPIFCNDGNACTTDSCVGKACVFAPKTGACSDNSDCTVNDTCKGGACAAGEIKDCDDGQPCNVDSCDPKKGCFHSAGGPTTCDDGDPCTILETCVAGVCKSGGDFCDDKNPCTKDLCGKGKCIHDPLSGACSDGNPCTTGEKCTGGACKGGTLQVCNDANACTADACDGKGGCIFSTMDQKTCDDGNACTTDSCVPASGCTHASADNGTACELDSDACTLDLCQAGTCGKGAAKVCGSAQVCVAGDCQPAPPAAMVWVPGGTFQMGCVAGDTACAADEKPQHAVTVKTFLIDLTEVSAAQYKACVDAGACSPPQSGAGYTWGAPGKDSHPVNGLSWSQAGGYCQWAGSRLPTEAEWERAARGGVQGKLFPWGDQLGCSEAVWAGGSGCAATATAAVGSKPAGKNGLGLLDVGGNVAEWVSDWYGDAWYTTLPASDPLGPALGTLRAVRGGGFTASQAAALRASSRGKADPAKAFTDIGVRCARSMPNPP